MTSPTSPPPGKDAGAAEIEADIERTRAQLGETVEALTAKLDVKTQAQDKIQDARARGGELLGKAKDAATDDHGAVTPPVVIGASVAALAVVVLLIWGVRR